jgi:hypothetical protein
MASPRCILTSAANRCGDATAKFRACKRPDKVISIRRETELARGAMTARAASAPASSGATPDRRLFTGSKCRANGGSPE